MLATSNSTYESTTQKSGGQVLPSRFSSVWAQLILDQLTRGRCTSKSVAKQMSRPTTEMGWKRPIRKGGGRRSWRSFPINALSNGAKRPLHHRRVLRGGRSRCCFGGGVDLGGHRADICLRIRNWVRVYLVGTAREAGRTANVSIRSRFARVKPVVDGFAAHAAVRRPSRRAISKFGTDPSCS